MNGRKLISEIKAEKYLSKKVLIAGYIKKIRNIGKVAFIVLNDRSGSIQCVLDSKEKISKIKSLQLESVISLLGCTVKTPNGKDYEFLVSDIEIISKVETPTPVELSKPTLDAHLDTILDNRSITLRHERSKAIFKIQATILYSFSNTLRNLGFTEFRSPVLIGVPSESGASVFTVEYYDNKAYLAQSPQLYKQIMVGVFERVFCISPVFRAERHNTSRHIMEMTQLDAELGFIEDYNEIMEIIQEIVLNFIKDVGTLNKQELSLLNLELPIVPKDNKIPKLKVKEVLEIIEKETGKSAERDELDLEPEDERVICEYVKKNLKSDFLLVLNYKKDKNFYTWNDKSNPDESLSYDLLFKGIEVLSGTYRIHDKKVLLERMQKQGLTINNYKQYLDVFEYGMPQHGGFSFGLERLTMKFCNLDNIKEATLFPSDLDRIASTKIKDIAYD